MKIYKIFILLMFLVLAIAGCDLLEPEDDNHNTIDRVYQDPAYAEGLLIRAYSFIPTNDYRWDEVATDDAVTNNRFSAYLRIATGEWSSIYNPQNLWNNANMGIMSINQFLSVVDSVPFQWTNEKVNALFVRRLTGESYALRGLFKYFLLRNHAGVNENGELLGVPEYNEFELTQEYFRKDRETFAESLNSAFEDLDKAMSLLPFDYADIKDTSELSSEFKKIVPDEDAYNKVFGSATIQRISGRHIVAIKNRLALLAASPAFNPDNNVALWEQAANYAAQVLDSIGGIAGMDPNGHKFFLKAQIDDADITGGNRKDLAEILWRRPIYTSRAREADNFPPSLYGDGRINPTQNFVDAFPMANGLPIDADGSGFDPQDPYKNRDPRLSLYVIYDGTKYKNTTINTGVAAPVDGLDATVNSTRTGYYLKKMLREDVNANPNSASDQKHFNTHIRYTEIFLNYAEAANEAWGPDGTDSYDYSAKDVIAAIRKRAGLAQPDTYLESISTKEQMRELIRNERRLELSFESFRFWDLRRWKADLTVPARGVRIENGQYNYFEVEPRAYDNDYMHYGPLPYTETIKFNLVQNKGWN